MLSGPHRKEGSTSWFLSPVLQSCQCLPLAKPSWKSADLKAGNFTLEGSLPNLYNAGQSRGRVRNRFENKFSRTDAIVADITLKGCIGPSEFPIPAYISFRKNNIGIFPNSFSLDYTSPIQSFCSLLAFKWLTYNWTPHVIFILLHFPVIDTSSSTKSDVHAPE